MQQLLYIPNPLTKLNLNIYYDVFIICSYPNFLRNELIVVCMVYFSSPIVFSER